MRVADIIPSKYMKAHVDVPEDGTAVVTMINVSQEKGSGDEGEFTLNLLHVRENDKPLKLNKGMLETIEKLYGGETEDWRDKRLTLFCTTQAFGGKDHNVIRIKARNPDATGTGAPLAKTVVKAISRESASGEPPF